MMDGVGKEYAISNSRPVQWPILPKEEDSSLIWNLNDHSSCEPSFPHLTKKDNPHMDNRKTLLDLKDIPPPPPPSRHKSPSQLSRSFPVAPLPLPPSCLLPHPQLKQDSHLQKPPPKEQGVNPKVSLCTHCNHCSKAVYSLLDGQCVTDDRSSIAGTHILHATPHSYSCNSSSGSEPCTGASSINQYQDTLTLCGISGLTDSTLKGYFKAQLNSPVSTSQPLSLHPQFPYFPSTLPSSASLAASISSPAPLQAFSPGFNSRGVDHNPSARTSLKNEPRTTAATATTNSAHFCSDPMHLNFEHAVCRSEGHYCHGCFFKFKTGQTPQSEAWPQTVSIPAPVCNGCSSSSDGRILEPTASKTGQKNASSENSVPENIPPVGVFWDIENCSVPSGRSAEAVVQRIRTRFFQGHREAEFICVCDISKESKVVIQELNNCQVTVAHINATAKNAADDKLRQSLRRFAETHTAPATVVLVSSDVNFASELSDLRHRHGFQVILVHGNHTSSALLQHAHQHVAFQEITADLPQRLLTRAQPMFHLLYVHNLPTIYDKSLQNAVKVRLRRLSDNCGGKVLGVSQGTAVLRFGSPEAAARARKRMENEDVFGHQISLSFTPKPKADAHLNQAELQSRPHRFAQTKPQTSQMKDSMLAPFPFAPSSSFLPLEKPRSPRRPRRATRQLPSWGPVPERPYSPRRGSSGPPGGAPVKPQQVLTNMEVKSRFGLEKERASSLSPLGRVDSDVLEQKSKLKLNEESLYRKRDGSSAHHVPESSVSQRDRSSGEFKISTPSAFSKLNLQKSLSPLVMSQGSWSPRSGSPCLSSRSSPLLATPRSSHPEAPPEPFSEGADIQVSNLDYRMSRKDLQLTLHDIFSRYGQVKVVELSPHTDYQLKATVQMTSLQQAICAVSNLHRYKVGNKRMQVSLITGGNNKSLSLLSMELICILQEAPANCLPLFKLTEIYEKKYSRKLAVADLYRLSDVLSVRDQGSSRLVCLLSNIQIRQSPLGPSHFQEGSSSASGSPVVFEELEYHEPVCRHHYSKQTFSEADFDPESYKIPFIVTCLRSLSSEVHNLLESHDGTLPLLSFADCYAATFSPLQLGNEMLKGGVPLEHLITCVPNITIVTAQNGFKVIKWVHNKPPSQSSEPWIQRCKSPVGNPQLIQFSREIIDLLKSQPSCIMPVSKFIPSYHHHFAKQCRVSDYGFSKLLELLEAVPHVLQILGMGTKRLLTLTHRAQVKRFTQDLLKLLKFQASKQVTIKDFMQAYHWCFSRDWRVTDYGVCDLLDLLTEIPDTTITVTQQATDTVICVPKRERTTEEMERTKQFGKEVVDLLRHQPHCRMPFSKFIPTYHHHFGRQCKLTYYGFTRLMDLFEAIPDILTVLECGEEKVLTLTEVERIKALAAQLVKLLRSQKNFSLPVSQLLTEYSRTFGYGLRLQDYDADSLAALLAKLCHVVMVVDGSGGREVQLINRKSLRLLTSQLLALLMSQEEQQLTRGMSVVELSHLYMAVYGGQLNPCEYGFLSLGELLKSLPYLVELYHEKTDVDGDAENISGCYGDERVRLTRLYQFARSVRALLHTYHYNQIFLTEFLGAYSKFTGCALDPRSYGYISTDELLSAIPQVVWIKGHGHKRIIVLKNDMKTKTSSSVPSSPQPGEDTESPRDSPSSSTALTSQSPDLDAAVESELLRVASPVDLLCGPVPSCLPSPQLHPDPILLQQMDLIDFGRTRQPVGSAGNGDPPEQPASDDDDDDAARRASPPPDLKKPLSAGSPGRRGARSRFRLAANFSFAGL